MIKTQEHCGWLSFLFLMEVEAVGYSCPSAITGNAKFCDTSKSWRHVPIWIQWNGKKQAVQFYSCESHPNPLNFTIAWFSTSNEYWKNGHFFCFVSKGPNQFGTRLGFTLRLTVNVKSGIGNCIWKKKSKKKLSLPVEISVELVYFWQHLRDKCCHINKEQEQSLPLEAY